jgi:hypothetical protein
MPPCAYVLDKHLFHDAKNGFHICIEGERQNFGVRSGGLKRALSLRKRGSHPSAICNLQDVPVPPGDDEWGGDG